MKVLNFTNLHPHSNQIELLCHEVDLQEERNIQRRNDV